MMFLSQKVSKKVLILFLSAIATGLIVACSNSSASSNKNLSMPAIDTTKVSPTPIATIKPVIVSTSASPAIDFNKLPELEISELEPYKHRSGLLEMSVPKGWQVTDSSQAGEVLVTWNEKAGRATISANIFVPPSEIPDSRLSDVFEGIIKGMYGTQSDFSMRSPVVEQTGNVVIEWTSTLTIGNKKVKFQANSKLQRSNNKLIILTFGAIEPKLIDMKDSFAKIANSQIVNSSLAIP